MVVIVRHLQSAERLEKQSMRRHERYQNDNLLFIVIMIAPFVRIITFSTDCWQFDHRPTVAIVRWAAHYTYSSYSFCTACWLILWQLKLNSVPHFPVLHFWSYSRVSDDILVLHVLPISSGLAFPIPHFLLFWFLYRIFWYRIFSRSIVLQWNRHIVCLRHYME